MNELPIHRDLDVVRTERWNLVHRLETLEGEVKQCQRGDTEVALIYEIQLRKAPLLVRREERTRVNRSAAVCYWREIRETEAALRRVHLEQVEMEDQLAGRTHQPPPVA